MCTLSRSFRVATLTIAAAGLGACQDRATPLPSEPAFARQGSTATCDQAGVARSINLVYPAGGARGVAHSEFNTALQHSRFGRADLATSGFLGIVADLITRQLAGQLLDPRGPTTTAQAVAALADQLHACAGLPPISDDLAAVELPAADPELLDAVVVPVLANQPFDIHTPADRFAFTDQDADFLDEPAIIVIYRIPDGPPFTTSFDEYPPRYHVDVLPYTAQQNFDDETEPGYGPEDVRNTSAFAVISICPSSPHPEPAHDLRVLREPESFLEESPGILPAATAVPLVCEQAPSYIAAAGEGSAIGRLLASGLTGLRRAGGRALELLAPASLHAVDGGAGGRVRLSSDFVAVAAGEDVIVVNDMNLLTDVAMESASNQRFARNLVSFTGGGSRTAGTVVIYDRGRNAPCLANGECGNAAQDILDAVVTDEGYTIAKRDVVTSYASIPADVRAIILFNPRIAFTVADINGLKQFAAQGGRIVFLGERLGFYGATGIAVENQFLQAMGAQTTNMGDEIDCGYNVLPGSSLREHQATEGVTELTIACASRVIPGPNDQPFLYDASNTVVLGASSRISVTPLQATVAGMAQPAGPAVDARRSAAPAATGPAPTGSGVRLPRNW